MEAGCYEAILIEDGIVTECCSSNIFLVKNSNIYTHPATNRILQGCVRDVVIQFAEHLDIPVIEIAFKESDLLEADELFLTSSISEVLPIIAVNHYPINDGQPGTITRNIQALYEKDANLCN